MAEEKKTDFRITDRRKFNSDGTPREESAEPQVAASAPEQATSQVQEQSPDEGAPDNVVSFPGDAAKKREKAEAERDNHPFSQPDESATDRAESIKAAASEAEQAYNQMRPSLAPHQPEASFLSLAEMLAGEAAMCLGLAQTPDGSKIPIDLETARHMVDMLGMLQQKTKGNLTVEEAKVLENILAYLRMQFVALSRRQ